VSTDAPGRRGSACASEAKFNHAVQRFHVDDERLLGVYERADAESHLFVLHLANALRFLR
jgi:hypothetical protein